MFVIPCLVVSRLVLSCLLLSSLFLSCLDLKFSYLPQAVFRHHPHLWSVSAKRNNTKTNGLYLPFSCHYLVLYSLVLSCLVLGLCVFFSFFISSLVLYCLTLCCLVWSSVIVFCHVLASRTLLSVLLCYLVLSGVGFSFLTFLSSTSGVKANTSITQNFLNALRLSRQQNGSYYPNQTPKVFSQHPTP